MDYIDNVTAVVFSSRVDGIEPLPGWALDRLHSWTQADMPRLTPINLADFTPIIEPLFEGDVVPTAAEQLVSWIAGQRINFLYHLCLTGTDLTDNQLDQIKDCMEADFISQIGIKLYGPNAGQ